MCTDEELDVIFELVDKLCWESNWEEIDRLLEQNMNEESMTLRIAWLTTSIWCKQHLKNRDDYFEKTKQMAGPIRIGGGLLQGLEP
jgi:hypothetical protein